MEQDKLKERYKHWKKLINMSAKEIEEFLDSDEGKEAGLSRKEAASAGVSGGKITSGRDSARAIIRMLGKKFEDWSENDWEWCSKQVSFISRALGGKGPLYDENGKKTRKLLSLLVWGHDPRKKMNEEINSYKRDFEMDFEMEVRLFEAEESKERVSTIPSDREIFFVKFCRMRNMSSSELASFLKSEEGKESGWTEEERKQESGSAAVKGQDIAKVLVSVLSKYSTDMRNEQLPKTITDTEMEAITLSQKFVSRFIGLPGKYKDEDGNLTPKAKALMLRAFDPIKFGNKDLPSTDEIKQELKKEIAKTLDSKINETVCLANRFL